MFCGIIVFMLSKLDNVYSELNRGWYSEKYTINVIGGNIKDILSYHVDNASNLLKS